MPKIVDHNQRKEALAEAAWRVIRREGIDGLSVRRVADEAGLSLGSLRHYFETQAELLTFSMQLVSERVHMRIQRLTFKGEPRHDMELVIAELMPFNEERRVEAEVWLAFAGKAIADPVIQALGQEAHDQLYAGFRRMIDLLVTHNLMRSSIDAEFEAKRLHALVDGLVLHHTAFPERLTREDISRVIASHLDSFVMK
ncbi:TetR family transcriptional regulator C-terminal domain-containing protein [Paenibacillus sp. FSL H7-0331]|uniref:TetR/AcrR family transcriptional regulator n=1 Tax=Paenibacillus sp. FSL H7-0331 TaxID=1920421 RepID=UPI00096CFEE7|nr:TetR family transcriptional regulator [Paenibacillus sp. FSL H7-0331]